MYDKKHKFRRMNYKSAQSAGFTLMEVLISAAIFAIVMAIATGVIAQGSTYATKIKKMRETSEDARRLSDMITRDIKSVKNPVKVKYIFDSLNKNDCLQDGTISGTFGSGILLLNSYDSSPKGYCILYGHPDTALNDPLQYNSSALVLAGSENYMIYVNGQDERVHYSNSIAVGTELTYDMINAVRTNSNIISNQNYYAYVGLGGFSAPVNVSTGVPLAQNMQSIVNFVVTVWDKEYTDVRKNENAVIRSSVSSRNYDIQ